MSKGSAAPDAISQVSAALNAARAPVSVIIPCYCCSDTIGRAMASIAAQSMLPGEVILAEDASADGGRTLDTLRRLAEQYADILEVRLIALKENSGAGSARNRGWEAAAQPYIAFLDADDAWHPKKIEIQYGWMAAHSDIGIVGHAHSLQQGQENHWRILDPDVRAWPVSEYKALFSNPFATRTVMLKRDLPFRFKEGKRYVEDYLLWMQIILSHIPAAFINQPLAVTFKADYGVKGLSSHLWKMETGELQTYWLLHNEGRVGLPLVLVLSFVSIAKYARRASFSLLRRIFGEKN
jgi:glycosyltransferase involved in cell wall biosynthesis